VVMYHLERYVDFILFIFVHPCYGHLFPKFHHTAYKLPLASIQSNIIGQIFC
jgi:hypothetical protein